MSWAGWSSSSSLAIQAHSPPATRHPHLSTHRGVPCWVLTLQHTGGWLSTGKTIIYASDLLKELLAMKMLVFQMLLHVEFLLFVLVLAWFCFVLQGFCLFVLFLFVFCFVSCFSQFSLQLKIWKCKREPFPQSLFCSPILHLGLDFPDQFIFFFTHFVCSSAFLVCTVMSSQLTSGPLHTIQEQEECTPMEHHQSSACLLYLFLCFSICLPSSTTSSIQSFLFPEEFLDMTL